jgi:hypothetical protein
MLATERREIGRFEEHTLPDGAVVYFEPEKHAYYGEIKENPKSKGGYSFVRDSRLTGVSGIAKFIDPNADPLMHWAAKLDQIGIARLASAAIAAGGDLTWLCEQESIKAALYDGEATWMHERDRAAERGTNVHERIFLALAAGDTPPSLADLSGEERGYGQGVFAWWSERSPEPLAAEQVTVSLTRRFAGRFDLLADVDKGDLVDVPDWVADRIGAVETETVRLLVDAKTREKGKVRKSDHVQLPGYETANRECGIGPSDLQLALILMPDGTYREEWCVGTETEFNSALLACQSGKHLEKRMREAEKARKAVAA